jgi:hypothetical protein
MDNGLKLVLDSSNAGSVIRAKMALALGIITFVVAVLQAMIDNIGVLPEWEYIGAVSIWIQAALSGLGKLTAIGNKIIEN